MLQVLVIDDEPPIRRVLSTGLEHNGYKVSLAATGKEGLDAVAFSPPALVILDLGLPDMDGIETCRQLRQMSKVPVIVLSVRDNEQDKIEVLNDGADDYLTKPFSLGELVARIRAVLRRTPQTDLVNARPPTLRIGDLCVNLLQRRVTVGGHEVHLTRIEYELLKYLALQPDRVLTHRQLVTAVWGNKCTEEVHTLRVHMANLRNKIEMEPARPRYLHTEPHIGYRFRAESVD